MTGNKYQFTAKVYQKYIKSISKVYQKYIKSIEDSTYANITWVSIYIMNYLKRKKLKIVLFFFPEKYLYIFL